MHRHLYVVRRPAQHVPVRPAKVVQLEARRQARFDVARDPRREPELVMKHAALARLL